MKVTITGGAGFIGANLARHMLAEGLEVTVLDNLSTGSLANLEGLDVRFHEGTILDPDDLARTCADADAIVHLAAVPSVPRSVKDPLTSHEANATGTLRVLEQARTNDAHVVLASSSSVYGANLAMPKSESMRLIPMSPYAVSKLATESYAIAYQHCYGLHTLPFRFFNVFGPLQAPGHAYAAVIPAFTYAALKDEPLIVHGDGRQTRDFTFVGTVAATITDAVRRRVSSPDPVNLAFGSRTDLLDLAGRIGAQMGKELRRRHVDSRPGDMRDSQADSTLLRSLFPDIEPVSLDDGLAETIAWMQATFGAVDAAPVAG
jgi:UDP-glucose 4-epimerase